MIFGFRRFCKCENYEKRTRKYEARKYEYGTRRDDEKSLLTPFADGRSVLYFDVYLYVCDGQRFRQCFFQSQSILYGGLNDRADDYIEMVLMGGMYPNKKLNLAVIGVSVIALLGFWFLIREQTGITDKQFLKSMIPHHAGAILMCEEAEITDAEIKQLCNGIINGQNGEIQQMKEKLNQLEK